MRIVIIEDEKPAATRMQKLLQQVVPDTEVAVVLQSVKASVEWFRNNDHPELLFCDIQLADGNAFELFEQVDIQSAVIFTTAYDQYAIRAFKVNAIDYLLKPIDPEELSKAIEKYQNRKIPASADLKFLRQWLREPETQFKSRFMVKSGERIISIPVEQVDFFVSRDKLTFLQTSDRKRYVLDSTLSEIQDLVDPRRFFRINRQYIVSMESIDSIHAFSDSRLKIELKGCDDPDILVSRSNTSIFRNWLDGDVIS
ncbi:LytTR family DNA-binding domain-containing protein [Balneolaceae bacterium ANBcel3]|nr:LytTR family DNA-binding domain-containing protein [Balneolaceae bacterium ANBcel3]